MPQNIYTIKRGTTPFNESPRVGSWYCHFSTITVEKTNEVYERDGNLGQYQGGGVFHDEEGFEIEMSSDLSDPWPDYLVEQT